MAAANETKEREYEITLFDGLDREEDLNDILLDFMKITGNFSANNYSSYCSNRKKWYKERTVAEITERKKKFFDVFMESAELNPDQAIWDYVEYRGLRDSLCKAAAYVALFQISDLWPNGLKEFFQDVYKEFDQLLAHLQKKLTNLSILADAFVKETGISDLSKMKNPSYSKENRMPVYPRYSTPQSLDGLFEPVKKSMYSVEKYMDGALKLEKKSILSVETCMLAFTKFIEPTPEEIENAIRELDPRYYEVNEELELSKIVSSYATSVPSKKK